MDFIGFEDVGMGPETLRVLDDRIEAMGARATDADPLALVAAARAALDGALIVAGADAFTAGAAAFSGSFSPGKGSLPSQLRDILACADGPLRSPGSSPGGARLP